MKLINKEGKELIDLDLGQVTVGESKTYEYFILNNRGTLVKDISVLIEGDVGNEVKILAYPKELKDGEKGLLKLDWTPNMKIKKGLRVQTKISGFEVYS